MGMHAEPLATKVVLSRFLFADEKEVKGVPCWGMLLQAKLGSVSPQPGGPLGRAHSSVAVPLPSSFRLSL